MNLLLCPALHHYTLGLAAVVGGAALSTASASWWPLALGTSVAVTGSSALACELRQRALARRRTARVTAAASRSP
ncbi:hypothetical protein [Rubrivivax gelatinosus]|uniref:Uncharacterized protein n=1 Tax=Rubrivivax gelatinosus TaxID=28068 RepID=A0A4R2MJJ9_RUBGE|nr:hypothetical protein [Rubrivivax gelatinosus]MBK1687998.1 hypothetical protein [Rubrivivax gelatinosus]TCO99282.1 hypothetical protein EV684_11575 [Rubrivivax gelatinosus]